MKQKKETNNYYENKKRVNIYIDTVFKDCKENNKGIDLKKMIYYLTLDNCISEKAIMERINLKKEIDKNFDIIEGQVIFK